MQFTITNLIQAATEWTNWVVSAGTDQIPRSVRDAATHAAEQELDTLTLTTPAPERVTPPNAPVLAPPHDIETGLTRCKLIAIDDLQKLEDVLPRANPDRGVQLALDLDETLLCQSYGLSVPVQDNTVSLVCGWQNRFPIFGLTSRPSVQAWSACLEVATLGLDLTQSAPWSAHEAWDCERAGADQLAGIVFSGETHLKGDLLPDIIKHNQYTLRHLIFVDDQPGNILSVMLAAARLSDGPELTGVWYTGWKPGATPAKKNDWLQVQTSLSRCDTASLCSHEGDLRRLRSRLPEPPRPEIHGEITRRLRERMAAERSLAPLDAAQTLIEDNVFREQAPQAWKTLASHAAL